MTEQAHYRIAAGNVPQSDPHSYDSAPSVGQPSCDGASGPAETEHIHAAIRSLTAQLTRRARCNRPLPASLENAYRILLDRQYRRLERSYEIRQRNTCESIVLP